MPRTYHYWTADDEAYLRQKWKRGKNPEKIARALGVTLIALRYRVNKLIQNGCGNLERQKARNGAIWRKKEDQLLRKLVAAKTPRADIAAKLNRTPAMVNGRARRLKIINHLAPEIA